MTRKGQLREIPRDMYDEALAYIRAHNGLQKAGDKEKYGRNYMKDGTTQDAKEIPGSTGSPLLHQCGDVSAKQEVA